METGEGDHQDRPHDREDGDRQNQHGEQVGEDPSCAQRPDQELAAKLREAGVPDDRDAPLISYCNGGVAATVPLFALHQLGYKNLANYDGSWNEWGGREDLPAERQSPPGE